MAKKEEAKNVLERKYVVNLRNYFINAKHYRKTRRAITGLKDFFVQHMKVEKKNIKIGKFLNDKIWVHGIRNPPCKVEVLAKKDDKGIVSVELADIPKKKKYEAKAEKKKAVKKEEKKPEEKKAAEKKAEKPAETKKEEKAAEKKEEAKPVVAEKKAEEKPKEEKKAEAKPAEKESEPEKKVEKPAEKKEAEAKKE